MAENKGSQWPALAKAELDRRGVQLPTVELSAHAVDRASLRVRKTWHETALNADEGLYSWLKLVVEHGEEWPVLKTIMPDKKGDYESIRSTD